MLKSELQTFRYVMHMYSGGVTMDASPFKSYSALRNLIWKLCRVVCALRIVCGTVRCWGLIYFPSFSVLFSRNSSIYPTAGVQACKSTKSQSVAYHTACRTALDEWSASRRHPSTWQHTTVTKERYSYRRRGFEPAIPAAIGRRPLPQSARTPKSAEQNHEYSHSGWLVFQSRLKAGTSTM